VNADAGGRDWVDAADHVAAYRRTDGLDGHWWRGRPHLLLGTTGRRSGREHTVPLVYSRLSTQAGERLVVAASAGGAETHPAWFLNLSADPVVTVRLWQEQWRTVAEQAHGEEEQAAWAAMGRTWEGFLDYRRRTARRIPLVLLGGPPGGIPAVPLAPGPDALP
jgi:deazaflavin-dependent oxidoreductase (nitroreductase family)